MKKLVNRIQRIHNATAAFRAKAAVVALLLPFFTSAQTFRWEAPVEQVPADGYYRILLPPAVTSQSKADLADARIYDKDSLETPYLIYKDEARQGVDRFVTYQIVDKQLQRGCCSHITVRNPLGNAIDHIVLEVNNADASRSMHLSGSYDGESWYTVRDQFTVGSFNTYQKGEHKTTSLLRFDFPLTDYKLYRFEFDDWHWWWHDYEYPVFVVRAGYTEPTFIPEECLSIPQPALAQTDSVKRKQSFIRITFADSQYVDHLRFSISTKKKGKDYYRAANLFALEERTRDGKTTEEKVLLRATVLSSLNDNEIDLGKERIKTLLLCIDNEDNLPVHVDSVLAFQVKHYLVAELEAGNKYVIRFGNDSITAPEYELRYFRNKIPTAPEVIGTGARKDIVAQKISPATMKGLAEEENKKAEPTLFRDPRFIWIAISGVVLLLGFMTVKMLREMKK